MTNLRVPESGGLAHHPDDEAAVMDWDELEDDLLEIPPDIVSVLTPAEVAKVDQLVAEAKSRGRLVIDAGGTLSEAIEDMADQLLELMDLVENAIRRAGEGEEPQEDATDDMPL